LVNFIEDVITTEGTSGQLVLPHTDQTGFQDEAGNSYQNWYYTATITYATDRGTLPPRTKTFQLTTGQTVVDLDLLATGAPVLPYTAQTATVTSFAGRTGAVTVQDGDLPTRLSDASLTATYARRESNLSDLASAPTARTNLGLGSVDNTADSAKPVSTAQATAIALKAPRTDLAYNLNTLPTKQGAVGDYTGRVGTAGTGTDSRSTIQAALDAASNSSDATYYGYLTTNSVTVKLPPGVYYISAKSDGTPSLVVPRRVTFDTSDAVMFFDPPPSAVGTWCGIQLGQYTNLIVGRLALTPGTTFPDTADVYDAVRVWQTDLQTKITGGKDSEIRGFQGACIRNIGAWITYISGIRFANSNYGIIHSNYYTPANGGAYGGVLEAPSGFTNRTSTDLRVDNCLFVNLSKGAILGQVQGKTGAVNSGDYTLSGMTVGLKGCVFENIGMWALNLINVINLATWNCDWEECGTVGSGMNYLDTVRTVNMISTRINLTGRSVPGPSGNITPSPTSFLQNSSVQSLIIESLYLHNTYNTTMKLTSATPTSYNTSGIYKDANDFAAGATYAGINRAMSGLWNTNHFALGVNHLWFDANGVLRKKSTAPTSDTDGTDMLVAKEINTTGLTSAQIDALFTVPTNGQTASDPTNGLMLVRQSGKWYKTAALTQIA
jgi:hypothetical protein